MRLSSFDTYLISILLHLAYHFNLLTLCSDLLFSADRNHKPSVLLERGTHHSRDPKAKKSKKDYFFFVVVVVVVVVVTAFLLVSTIFMVVSVGGGGGGVAGAVAGGGAVVVSVVALSDFFEHEDIPPTNATNAPSTMSLRSLMAIYLLV
jgi:hypothetical protein